jgi:hypothetical protein
VRVCAVLDVPDDEAQTVVKFFSRLWPGEVVAAWTEEEREMPVGFRPGETP